MILIFDKLDAIKRILKIEEKTDNGRNLK